MVMLSLRMLNRSKAKSNRSRFPGRKRCGIGNVRREGYFHIKRRRSVCAIHVENQRQLKSGARCSLPDKTNQLIRSVESFKYSDPIRFHRYADTANNERSFYGLGPSIAWSGSLPVVGDPTRGEVSFDWGANAAVLFGRRKAGGQQQMITGSYYGTHFDKNNEFA